MYYLIQSNIHSDPEHHKIFDVLSGLNLPYETIELAPDADTVNVQTDRTDIFVYGSVRLARLAKANTHWKPGSLYGGNHRFEVYAPQYGEYLLNYGAVVFKFGEPFSWTPGESRFIKPYAAAKVFTGKVFTAPEWNDFVYESLASPRTPLLHAETPVQASAPQHVIKEARTWIVGGQVIAGVYYKFNGDIPFEKNVAPEGLAFAQAMAKLYEPADAFVMDIGLTENGWKIVEINCINSAGFYSLDARPLFRALEMFF